MNVAYIRVSSASSNIDRQLDDLQFDKTYTDESSGGSKQRPALTEMIDYVRKGDTVHVHSIDRLARDLRHLLDILMTLNDRGVGVRFHKENLSFTGEDNPMQKMQIQIMGSVAEFERSIIRERQAEGIAKAKARGVYKGRKRSVDHEKVRQLKGEGMGATAIAKKVGIARGHVYRILSAQ